MTVPGSSTQPSRDAVAADRARRNGELLAGHDWPTLPHPPYLHEGRLQADCPGCGMAGEITSRGDAGLVMFDCDARCSASGVYWPGDGGLAGLRLPLEVMTARAVCELPEPPVEDELVGPLVVRGGRLVLGGHTGEGKTTLGLQILAAIATGGELLGWQARKGRALVIDAEQGLRTIKRRLREAGIDDSEQIDYLRAPDGLRLDTEGGEHLELERLIVAGGYSVVLADPLYKLHGGDSNDERQAVDLMRRFDGWRERHHFALVLPVHCRKTPPGAKFSLQEFFGSTGYLRGAEVVVGIQRVRAGYSFLYFFKDRDGDLPIGERWGLLFDRDEGFRRDPEDGKPRLTAAGRVAELLEAQPGATIPQLVEGTGYADRTVRDALTKAGASAGDRPGKHGEKPWYLEPQAESQLPFNQGEDP